MALLPWGSMCMLWIAPPERLPNDFITEALVCQQFFNKKGRFSRSFQCEWRGSNPHAQRAQDFKSRLSAYSNTLATVYIIPTVQLKVKKKNNIPHKNQECLRLFPPVPTLRGKTVKDKKEMKRCFR